MEDEFSEINYTEDVVLLEETGTDDYESNTDISSEITEIIYDTDNSNTIDVTTTYVLLAEEQFNLLENNLKVITHSNYILISLLLGIFIYLFLSRMLERKKV